MIQPPTVSERSVADAENVPDLLDDADCRAFLEDLDDPRTATKLSRPCDVPHSAAYRKLGQLHEDELVGTTTEI